MVRRSRYLILLSLVLAMIYLQQGSVLQAENKGTGSQSEEETDTGEQEAGNKEEEGGQEPEEEEPEEEGPEEPICKFVVKVPEPDGKNGYYRHKPEIQLSHRSKRGVTRYRLTAEEIILAQGSIQEEGETITFKDFREGRNDIYIWMEDEEQQKVEDCEEKIEVNVDTQGPEIKMSTPGGFDRWHQGKAELYVEGADSVSGVEEVCCTAGGKETGRLKEKQAVFTIKENSVSGQGVSVTATARDLAGNETHKTETLYIDAQAPKAEITGAAEYLITSKPVTLTCTIEEENVLAQMQEQTVWENIDGNKTVLADGNWSSDGTRRILERKLTEDGIYRTRLLAKDQAGYETKAGIQVILDQKDPIIRKVDQIQGKYLKAFAWDYPAGEWIQDFTTYAYEIRLDGRLYPEGKEVTEEGRHTLEVNVEDAAGNRAEASAGFVIDHTAPEIEFLNVEDGKKYEEKITFQVRTEKSEDQIHKIWINGKEQEITRGKGVYEYTAEEYGNCEVRVEARDRAGNLAEESILFQIVEKKNLFQKLAEPVARKLGLSRETPNVEKGKEEARNKTPWIMGGAAGIMAAVGSAGFLIWRKRKGK
ncbi:hypothetical protein FND36_03380 [Lachnospiraceae bacterium KGMB03038]|nr:hypothetical protein FND36_03380 [Lachnospiraceae bacterium KGMB03038]